MRTVGFAHVFTLLLIGLDALVLSQPRAAHAFAAPAIGCVAERLGAALPASARWQAAWNAAVSDAVVRRLAAEADDPERFAPRHRLAVGSLVSSQGDDAFAGGAEAVNGYAARELDAAAAALRSAFEQREPSVMFERLADLAITATDLADPFQVVGLDHPEPPGARAAFSDLMAGSLPASLEAYAWASSAEPFTLAMGLAEESAGARGAIEMAIAQGDPARLNALRRERLEAALRLARSVASQAWYAAGGPAVDPTDGAPSMHIWPNPVSTEAMMSFRLPTSGEASVELFDLAGRRVWNRNLGWLGQGPHMASLSGPSMRLLPAGIYSVRLTGPHFLATGRLARVTR